MRLGERQGGVEVGCLEDGVADDLTGAGGRAIGRDADTAGDGVPKSTMRSPTSAGPGGPSAHDGFHLLGGGRRCFRGVIGAWWVKTYLGMIRCFSQNRRGPTTSGRVFLTRCAVRQCLLESPAPAMIWSRPMEIVARETAPILDVCHHCLRTATSRDYVTKGAGRPILNRLRWRRRVISPRQWSNRRWRLGRLHPVCWQFSATTPEWPRLSKVPPRAPRARPEHDRDAHDGFVPPSARD